MVGKIYLVATPIGNLEDITLRAIRILKEADIIVAEDTRQTLKLLNHLEISKPMISYHRHSNEDKKMEIIEQVEKGKQIALVSDAGTPVISDPGEEIVQTAIERGIQVIPIPGPCALISALIASGIDAKEFTFLGFLPLNKKLRKEKLNDIESAKNTVVLYEAPHKLKATLTDLSEITEDRKIVLAKEITKIHEQYIRGTISTVLEQIVDNVKGEFVVIVDGAEQSKKEFEISNLNEMSLEEHYNFYENQGLDKKEIIKKISKDRSTNKNEIYQYFLNK